jgi:hypothetical protein
VSEQHDAGDRREQRMALTDAIGAQRVIVQSTGFVEQRLRDAGFEMLANTAKRDVDRAERMLATIERYRKVRER